MVSCECRCIVLGRWGLWCIYLIASQSEVRMYFVAIVYFCLLVFAGVGGVILLLVLLMLFAICCYCYLLLFVAICCHLLLFVAICCYLLLFVAICCLRGGAGPDQYHFHLHRYRYPFQYKIKKSNHFWLLYRTFILHN